MDKIKISVVIPCYNEEKRISATVKHLLRFFFKHRKVFDYELIFVLDGCSDSTHAILEYYKTEKTKIVWYERNKGKGYAIRAGINNALFNNILLFDADLAVLPEEILTLQEVFNLHGETPFAVNGLRKQIIKQNQMRLFLGRCYAFVVNLLFRLPVSDTQCPFKFFHNINKEVLCGYLTNGFAFDVELLKNIRENNVLLFELPVKFYDRKGSKVTPFKTVKMLFELAKIKLN